MSHKEMECATIALTNIWESDHINMLKSAVGMLKWLPSTIADLYHEYKPDTGTVVPGKLYRHGICHGLQLYFSSEENSLRLILIIDRLVVFYTKF